MDDRRSGRASEPHADGGFADEDADIDRASPVEQDSDSDPDTAGQLRTAAMALLFGAVGFVAMFAWGFVLLSLAIPLIGSELSAMEETLLNTAALGLGMPTGVAVYLYYTDRGIDFLDLGRPSLRGVGYVVGGLIALFAAVLAISQLSQFLGVPPSDHGTIQAARDGNPDILLALIPLSLLVIGPGEELLFRNVVQKHLYGAFQRPAAIGVASVIFALVHVPAYAVGDPTASQVATSIVTVFLLSLLLGWIYHRTENIVVPALIHGLYNALLFGSVYVELIGLV